MDEVPHPAPDVAPHDELRARIDQLDRLVGTPKGEEMKRLAELSAAELPESTLSDLRAGRRVPQEATLEAFVKACLRRAKELRVTVPPPLDDWAAWQRLREAAARTRSRDSSRSTGSGTAALSPAAFVPMAKLVAPAGLANPPVLCRRFVGHTEVLSWLDGISAGTAYVVHGLGGCGKTTLVAHWLSRHPEKYNPAWWITADSADGLNQGLASLAAKLQPALEHSLPVDIQSERAVQWLVKHDGWLLVLDNVGDPSLAEPLLSRLPKGRFVITSRRATGWDRFAVARRLDVLPLEEAVELAMKALPPGRRVDLDGITRICAELGRLPLAVEQAAVYLAETGIDACEYLNLLAQYPADVYRSGGVGWSPEKTVARVWAVTLARLASDSLTIMVLRVLAWFAPRGIPRGLLDGLARRPAVHDAIRQLGAHSMILVGHGTLDVHRLVQAVARTPGAAAVADDELLLIDQARRFAAAALRSRMPDDPEADPTLWSTWSALSPHILAYLDRTNPSQDEPDAEFMAYQISRFLRGQGQYASVLSLAQRSADVAARLYGDDTLPVTDRLTNLAEAHLATGNPSQGLALHHRVLCLRRALLDERDPRVFQAQDRLAHAYLSVGDTARAVEMHERLLTDLEQVLGPDAPFTLIGANDLVHAMLEHDVVRGLPLAENVLERCERALGGDHPQTLTARHNWAGASVLAKDWETAIPLFEQIIVDSARVLGAKHPDTLKAQANLAGAYFNKGAPSKPYPFLNRSSPTPTTPWASTAD
ncbi:tetratricopeptide repeat protein [Nocardia suismassiliense]|uniref:Tetratricopeptide repeat protein n=1 Tax=Nocardia suismassiliense TaxID=2077092 RepID=A0ABW6R5Q4_9NOCA